MTSEELDRLHRAHKVQWRVRVVARRVERAHVIALPVVHLLRNVSVDAKDVIAELLQPPQVVHVAAAGMALVRDALLVSPLAHALLQPRVEAAELNENRVDARPSAFEQRGGNVEELAIGSVRVDFQQGDWSALQNLAQGYAWRRPERRWTADVAWSVATAVVIVMGGRERGVVGRLWALDGLD